MALACSKVVPPTPNEKGRLLKIVLALVIGSLVNIPRPMMIVSLSSKDRGRWMKEDMPSDYVDSNSTLEKRAWDQG